jgi:hypothetical protein
MQNSESVVETVPNPQLEIIIKANALPSDLGNVIQDKFSGAFAQLDEWKSKSDALVITSEDQVAEIALANDGRKTLQKIRTSLEKTRVELKGPYLAMGRAIDAVCKSLTERIEPIEQDLKTKAEYAANLAAERLRALVAERRAMLIEVGHSGDIPSLGEMPKDTFLMILDGAAMAAKRLKDQQEREASELAAAQELERKEKDRIANRYKLGQSRKLEIVELGAKLHNGDMYTYQLGNSSVAVDQLYDLLPETWAICLASFQHEANRIADEAKEAQAIKDRANERYQELLSLGAKRQSEDSKTLVLGQVVCPETCFLEYGMDQWGEVVSYFKEEADRLEQKAKQVQQSKDRFNARVQLLLSIGAKSIDDAINSRLELGQCKVMLVDLVALNEADQRWDFTLTSFQDEAQRIATEKEESDRKAKDRLQIGNDRLAQLLDVGFRTMFADVADLLDAEFDLLLSAKTSEFKSAKQAQERADSGRLRKAMLDVTGEIRSVEFLGNLDESDWESLYANAKRLKTLADQDAANELAQKQLEASQKAIADQKVKDDAAAKAKAQLAPDKEKLQALVVSIGMIEIPECATISTNAIALGAKKRLAALIDDLEAAIAEL